MGLFIKKQLNNDNVLAIWKMTESIKELKSLITEEHLETTNIKRQKEWLATRILIKEINPEYKLTYNKYNAPRIMDMRKDSLSKKNISITHTRKFIAIIIGSKK